MEASMMDQACACGSGKMGGACCMSERSCACGSGNKAGECCFAA